MVEREVQVRDEVKHVREDEIGTVLAKYPFGNPSKNYLDIRLASDKIYYCTPAENWITVVKVEDIE